MNALIESVLNIVWNEIKYKAGLKKELGQLPPIECNGQQIVQVVMNLMMNAGQAIESSGVITVRTYVKNDSAYIEVEDTGKGIPEEVVGKIYDPFFTTKEVGKGTGLGLSISYDIIKKHQGTIQVDSKVGQGTKFTVTLPVSQSK